MDRFDIEVLATTDDPADDLRHHAALRDDPAFTRRVVPTFRPDRYLEPGRADFPQLVADLGRAAGVDTGTYRGYIAALEERRRAFKALGAVSSDHSHADVVTLALDEAEAARISRVGGPRRVNEAEATAFRRHMLVEMAGWQPRTGWS